MKKTTLLTQLAVVGIAAGLVAVAPAHADKHAKKSEGPRTEKSGCKGKNACKGPGGCARKDSVLGKKVAADSLVDAKASCRGRNACKGQGGCAMSDKKLEKRAKELGIPRSEAGEAHSCKGKNACKGLGGCNM